MDINSKLNNILITNSKFYCFMNKTDAEIFLRDYPDNILFIKEDTENVYIVCGKSIDVIMLLKEYMQDYFNTLTNDKDINNSIEYLYSLNYNNGMQVEPLIYHRYKE